MLTFYVVLAIFLTFVAPTVILGEIIYGASRSVSYTGLEAFSQTTVTTEDIVNINVWYTEKQSKVALLVHGHGDHAGLMLERYAPLFQRLNYDLILVDLRNHGISDHAPPVTMGVEERLDVKAAIKWADERNWDEMVVFGTSMGSIAALLATEECVEEGDTLVSNLILGSSFADPVKVMNNNFEKNYIIQPWRWMVVQYLTRFKSDTESFPDILTKLSEISISTLVVHGSSDVEAPPSFLLEVDNLENDYIVTRMIKNGEHSLLHLHGDFVEVLNSFLEAN